MKTVRILGDRNVAIVETAEPEASREYVVVKVMASSIGSSERRYFEGGMPAQWAGVRENSGHEAAGIVWKSAIPKSMPEGKRVTLYGGYRHCGRCRFCRSGRWLFCEDEREPMQAASFHSQYARIRSDFCLPLPDGISFDAGALLTATFGSAFRAIRRLRVTAEDRVFIAGQGPVGLAATMLCKFLGATVIVAEPNRSRLDLAIRLGAVGDADAAGRGVTVAIDCSGRSDGRRNCLNAVDRGNARVAFLGFHEGLQLDLHEANQIALKEIELIGSWYSDPADVASLTELMGRGLDVESLVTHRFSIDDAAIGFATSFSDSSGKVILLPWAT